MATTVKSSDLDFQNIKNNLKNYFKNKSEFADYDFEAAGLNNFLDVLAYNTHINGLTANFAINESFLSTSQLRSSVVSHAETLGYEVRSRTTAKAIVNISINLAGVSGRPPTVQLPSGWTFSSSIDNKTYTFRTLESYFAKDDGFGNYEFKTADGSDKIPVYEGIQRTKTFLSGEKEERQIFVIPDDTIDTATASVLVYDTASSTNYVTYIPLKKAVTIDKDTTVYTLRETPNGFYELNFGDGISFGKKPDPGNKVVVTYLSSVGPTANAGDVFTSNSDLNVDGIDYAVTVVTDTESTGGAEKQTIESVRQLAPIAYAAQQRLVTSLDYKATILSNFTDVSDCNVWSGDENVPLDYGSVYIALNFPTNTSAAVKTKVKNDIVNNFTDNLSVVSITTKFVDPTDAFIELNVQFDYDPALTGFTLAATETSVFNFMRRYFTDNLNTFNKVFRRSNLLTEIDAIDAAILSSKADVKVQLRFTPTVGTIQTHELAYPMKIKKPDDVTHIVTSSIFQYQGAICQIKNKLESTKLEIVDVDGNILVDNIGQYNSQKGTVEIVGFAPQGLIGSDPFIKVSVVPENESVIKPLRNYILRIDNNNSSATANVDRQTTSLKVT
jgi:hypothetical protein